ncbi:MAG: c-type cytochrome, partial [Gemmatimonadota bacterium]|nr:c-type cytochrome [Gemmatimonadota bacterium]
MHSFLRTSATCTAAIAALQMTAAPASAQALGDHQYTSAAVEAGSRLYVSECALCHGPQGARVDGIDLRRGQFRGPRSDEDLRRVITAGVGDSRMPAFDFSAAELDGIIAYIRAGFDPGGVAVRIGDAERGRAVFAGAGDCASCHRVNGIGPRAAPDLSDVGAVRTPGALQRSLLDPYNSVIPINRPVMAVTQDGEIVRGRRLNEDTYTVQVMDSDGRLRSLVKEELVDFEISRSPTHEPTRLS